MLNLIELSVTYMMCVNFKQGTTKFPRLQSKQYLRKWKNDLRFSHTLLIKCLEISKTHL